MARLLVWADLHDEFWQDIPDIPEEARDVDALLLAGDTSTQGRHVNIALHLYETLGKPIIMIRGNHEFYKSTLNTIMTEDRNQIAQINAQGGDIRMLEGNATEIAGTRIIAATLWTDLDLYPGYATQTFDAVRQNMNDFNLIKLNEYKKIDIETWLEMHWAERKAIFNELSKPYDGPTIVMTHHIPVREMIHPKREIGKLENYLVNAGFASNMAWQIRECEHDIKAWICGHSHDNHHAEIQSAHGMIPFIANTRGYPGEKQQADFNPGYILDTENPNPGLLSNQGFTGP